MLNKIVLILLLNLFSSNLFAHKEASVDIQIRNLENDYSAILVKSLRSKKNIWGNQVKILSTKNGRVIKEFILTKENNKYKNPNEEYYVVVKIGSNLLYKSSAGKNNTFNILLGISAILLLIWGIIIFKTNKTTKRYL